MARLFVLLSIVLFNVYRTEQIRLLDGNSIDKINEQASTWKSGVDVEPSAYLGKFADLLKLQGSKGKKRPNYTFKSQDKAYLKLPNPIPETFDARDAWKNCSIIGKVLDQGHCDSDWAVSTSSAFADRLCIATGGKFDESLSAEELISCSHSSGYGCDGGFSIKAWEHFKSSGLVTGGDYGSSKGCQPYRIPPCPLDKDGSLTCEDKPVEKRHLCMRRCYGNQTIDIKKDRKRTKDAYYLTYESIQKDVMAYGPITATFEAYEGFMSYKSGVYIKPKDAAYLGIHSAKLIGWGKENGVPYWLLINSYNKQWGDKGIFKIRRGTNECGIDDSTTGGVPLVV